MRPANQMHGRYARFLKRQHPGGSAPHLVHGMAWLLDNAAPKRLFLRLATKTSR
jgi:hypothetical protein